MSFPYSYLHHLRRFGAHVLAEPDWEPTFRPEGWTPADIFSTPNELIAENSHLLCHADGDGYYVPIDFPEPLFADEEQIPGGMLGSSQGLMRELVAVAPKLGITLRDGVLSDADAQKINDAVETEDRFAIESMVWLARSRRRG